MNVIEVNGLVKNYGDLKAVDNVSFGVEVGEIFGILGPNGAGKTTTLEMIEGLRQPDAGSVSIKGIQVWPDPGATKALIGVQLQTTALFDYLTVREMLALFGSFYRLRLTREKIDGLLDAVSLKDKQKSRVNELSGGQQQRLSISLALVNDPEVVFLDEPTTGLDPQARRRLWDVVREISSRGKTIVLTTHYMEEAEVLCGRVAIMDAGRVIEIDTPKDLIDGLGAEVKITFRSDRNLELAELKSATGASDISKADDGYVLHTSDVQGSIVGLFGHAQKSGSAIENLSVSGADLEDVFLHHTGKGLRD
ncbi:MAG: ABC transporter ATP-binding protein [Actinomycetota bacterium]|nr:ABC transporter ATP-binding protein [Actinomycetota bacterium]